MNRYTQLTPARYTPRSTQEMMALPMMKRQQHDQSVASAYQMGLFNNKALDVDKEKVEGEISGYEEEINSYVEELAQNGVDNNTSQGLINLARKRQQLEKETIQPAEANYQAIQKYTEELMKTEGWSKQYAQDYAQANIQEFIGNGGTFGENGINNFQGKYMPKYVDANKRLDDAIEKVKAGQYQTLMAKYDIEGVDDIHTFMASTQVESVHKNKIINAIQTELSGDTEFQKSYMTQHMLDGGQGNPFEFGQFKEENGEQIYQPNLNSPLDRMLYGKALGAEYEKQSLSFSQIKGDTSSTAADKAQLLNGSYHLTTAKQAEVFRDNLIEEVTNVADEKIYTSREGLNVSASYDTSYGLTGSSETKEAVEEPWTYDRLSDDNKQQFDEIVSALIEEEHFPEGVDPKSRQAFEYVADYLKPFAKVAAQDREIDPYTAINTEHQGMLLISKDYDEAVKKMKQDVLYGRRKVWDKNGKLVEVDEDFFEKAGDVSYLGYTSANNHIREFEDGAPTQTVMPHLMGVDGEKYYIERIAAERDHYSFRAAEVIKQATAEGLMKPMLPVEHTITDELAAHRFISMTTKYDPLTNKMDLIIQERPKGEERLSLPIEVKYEGLDMPLFNNLISGFYAPQTK